MSLVPESLAGMTVYNYHIGLSLSLYYLSLSLPWYEKGTGVVPPTSVV